MVSLNCLPVESSVSTSVNLKQNALNCWYQHHFLLVLPPPPTCWASVGVTPPPVVPPSRRRLFLHEPVLTLALTAWGLIRQLEAVHCTQMKVNHRGKLAGINTAAGGIRNNRSVTVTDSRELVELYTHVFWFIITPALISQLKACDVQETDHSVGSQDPVHGIIRENSSIVILSSYFLYLSNTLKDCHPLLVTVFESVPLPLPVLTVNLDAPPLLMAISLIKTKLIRKINFVFKHLLNKNYLK